MNHFMEIAKMRAARVLWAKLIKQFNPKNPKSMALRTHSPDLGLEPDRAGPLQQRRRAPASRRWPRHSATPSRCTPTRSTKPSRCRPISPPASRATRRSTCRRRRASPSVVDPWAGSYYVETLTHELMHTRLDHIQEVEAARRHGQGHRDRPAQDAHRGSRRAPPGAHRFRPRDHRRA